jgi:LysM repeat protein
MKPEVNSDTQEIFDHMAEDLARHQRNDPSFRRQRDSYGSSSSLRFILLGLGAAIVVLLFILVIRGTGKVNLVPLQNRIDQLEKKTAQIDGNAKKIDALEGQIKALQQTLSKWEGAERSLGERVDKLAKQMGKPQAEPAAQKAKAQAKTRYYEVRSGDTVYSIAKKYGISMDHLRRLNKLKKDAEIKPGQKLLIPAERP